MAQCRPRIDVASGVTALLHQRCPRILSTGFQREDTPPIPPPTDRCSILIHSAHDGGGGRGGGGTGDRRKEETYMTLLARV